MSVHQAKGNRIITNVHAAIQFVAGSTNHSARRAPVQVNAAPTVIATAISNQSCRTSFLKICSTCRIFTLPFGQLWPESRESLGEAWAAQRSDECSRARRAI